MIVVLGSEGRIGKSIVSHLTKIGHKVTGIDILKKNKQDQSKYQFIQADLSKKKKYRKCNK